MSFVLDTTQIINMPLYAENSVTEELLCNYTYAPSKENIDHIHRFYCASIARKALPSYGKYGKCGWSEKMTGPGL